MIESMIRNVLTIVALTGASAIIAASSPSTAAADTPSPPPLPPTSSAEHTVLEGIEEVTERTICHVSGALGWIGGLIGGNDICGDTAATPTPVHAPHLRGI